MGSDRMEDGLVHVLPACLTRYAFVALLVRPSVADEGWTNRICTKNVTDCQSEWDVCELCHLIL